MAAKQTYAPYRTLARAKREFEITLEQNPDIYPWKEGETLREAYWNIFNLDLWEPAEKQ